MLELPLNDPVVVSHVPYVIRRTVRWGDCDPSGIVHVSRYVDYATDCCEAWFKEVTGYHWNALRREFGMASAAVNLRLDFAHALMPEDQIDVTIDLDELSRSTYRLSVGGCNSDGTLCFGGTYIGALVNIESMKSIAIPADFRDRMNAYLEACDKARLEM